MVNVNPIKTLEYVGKYKNGKTYNLRISSNALMKCQLECLSFNKNGKIIGGFGEVFNSGSKDKFTEWTKNFIEKIKNTSADSDIVSKVSDFFASITK